MSSPPGALIWLNSSQMPPHVPGRGVVGHYFDRCITSSMELNSIGRSLPIPSPGMITVLHIIALTFYNLNPTSKLLGSQRVQGKTVMMHFQSRFQYTSTGRMDRLYPGRAQFIHAAGTGILESGLKRCQKCPIEQRTSICLHCTSPCNYQLQAYKLS